MKTKLSRTAFVWLAIGTFLALLSGCGGSSSTAPETPTPTPTPTPQALHDLTGSGLIRNADRNPTSGSFSNSVAERREFSPLTATIIRDFDESTSTLTQAASVTSIQRTASGLLEVGFMFDDGGGTERGTFTFARSDCQVDDGDGYLYCDSEEQDAFLFSWTQRSTFDFDQGDEFEHMEFHTIGVSEDGLSARGTYLFGINPEALPTGNANYVGRFRADAYKMTDPDSDQRVRYNGALLLSANFDMSELNGRVYAIRGSQPGQSDSSDRVLWPTSSFTITDGRIVDGQFTAVLTGQDSSETTPFNRSVRGFMGHILGEFFGPNAEEVGAVLSASRDVVGTEHDYVLAGFVGGHKQRTTPYEDNQVLATSVNRDFGGPTTQLIELQDITISEDDDLGVSLTYTVNSETVDVSFTKDDLGGDPNSPIHYYVRTTDGQEHYLALELENSDEFNHFAIREYARGNRNSDGDPLEWSYNYLIYGDRTQSLPATGTATYTGPMLAREWRSDDAVFTGDSTTYRGAFSVTADFADSSVGGTLTANSGAGSLDFTGTVRADGEFTGTDLTGTLGGIDYANGGVSGAFYGSQAAETGGVFGAANTSDNRVLHGYFGGRQN
jgi:hypothetical protein